jgi:hypothetical protein
MYVGEPLLEDNFYVHSTDFEECLFKDHTSHQRHMDGIDRIVELRGGIDSLRATTLTIYWRVIMYSPEHLPVSQTRC